MNPQRDTLYFYETLTDICFSKPYAELSSLEARSILGRFLAWAAMLETHPHLTEMFTDEIANHVQQVGALPVAVQRAKQAGIFPKIVLPKNQYTAAMKFMDQTRKAAPEVMELLKSSSVLARL